MSDLSTFKLSPELEILIRAIRTVFMDDVDSGDGVQVKDGSNKKRSTQNIAPQIFEQSTQQPIQLSLKSDRFGPIPDFDPLRLMRLAQMHKIRPILAEYDRQTGLLDPNTRDQLNAIRSRQVQRNLKMVHVLQQVIQLLSEKKIDVVPMKGNLFIHTLYGNQQLRETGDIDILVPRSQVKSAVHALKSLGFKLNVNRQIVPNEHYDALLDMLVDSPRQSELKLDDGQFHIDVHWEVAQPHYGFKYDTARIFENRQEIDFYNQKIKIPSHRDIFAMMLIHHGGKEHWKSLRHFVDLYMVFKMMQTWEVDVVKLYQDAEKIRVNRTLQDGLRMYTHLINPDSEIPNLTSTLKTNHHTNSDYCTYPTISTTSVLVSDQPPHLKSLIKMWEGSLGGVARSFWYHTMMIRLKRSDRGVSRMKLMVDVVKMSIESNKLRAYPQKFGSIHILQKSFKLSMKILKGI